MRKDGDPSRNPKRVLFCTNEATGLGHLRRTLLLCEGLRAQIPDLSTLLVTGSAMAHGFRLPPGVDYVKLPCVTKVAPDRYVARSLNGSVEQALALRERITLETTRTYRPDILFVDHLPLGVQGELRKTLEYVTSHLPNTRVVLNLRDILDDGPTLAARWRQTGVFEALEEFYDRILIYGVPAVYDMLEEYEFPEAVRRKTSFCGYIPRPVDKPASVAVRRSLYLNGEKFVVVTVGGGFDGARVVERYLEALPNVCHHTAVTSLVLLGPEMQPDQARRIMQLATKNLAANGCRIKFADFVEDALPCMDAADLVISMAGYNAVSEILWLKKKAITIPRRPPRQEQLIRSEKLQQYGLTQVIHPDKLTPERLARETIAALHSPGIQSSAPLEFTALERLRSEVSSLLAEPVARRGCR